MHKPLTTGLVLNILFIYHMHWWNALMLSFQVLPKAQVLKFVVVRSQHTIANY